MTSKLPPAQQGPKAKGLTKDEKLEIISAFYADPVLAVRELLPHWFPRKMPWVHRGLLALIREYPDFLLNFGKEVWRDEEAEWTVADLRKIESHFVVDGKKLFNITWLGDVPTKIDLYVSDKMLAVMPRGFSKTTLFKADIILDILYQLRPVQLYLSEAGPHAASQVNDIRMELQFNERIIELYGKLAPERQDPQKWTDEEFETLTGMHLIARGRGGQVRGLNRGSNRPSKILFDDLEDEESVSTPEQREKVLKWLRGAVERAGQLLGRTKIFGIGTILHHESLLMTLPNATSWMKVTFGAIDKDGAPLWEIAMSLEKIEQTKLDYVETGTLPVFYREILSVDTPDEERKFRLDKLVYIPRRDNIHQMIVRSIAMDPAISNKVGASLCAFAVVGMTEDGTIHICDEYARAGMNPREQIDKYFELSMQWKCNKHGIEAIAYQQALIHLMKEEMFRKGKQYGIQAYFEITPIIHQTKEAKHKRIEGVLQPRYKAGYVTHERVFPEYELALRDWPNCKMDRPDAVAMAVTLLDEYAGLAGGDEVFTDTLVDVEEECGDFRNAI